MDHIKDRVRNIFRPLSGRRSSTRDQDPSPNAEAAVARAATTGSESNPVDRRRVSLDSNDDQQSPSTAHPDSNQSQLFPFASCTGSSEAVSDPTVLVDPLKQPHAKYDINAVVKIKLNPYNPYFPIIERDMRHGDYVSIGRMQRTQPEDDQSVILLKSSVVSRKHSILHFRDGQFFLRDNKSLGGTYVNASRLSPAAKESKFLAIKNGDIVQFGVDYRPDTKTGQVRNKDRCVEVHIELPRPSRVSSEPLPPKWDASNHKHTECCICISSLYTKQALFIAPCSHTFHFRCIAPLLRACKSFTCPMCRQVSDLNASVFEDDDDNHVPISNLSPLPTAPTPSAHAEPVSRLVETVAANMSRLLLEADEEDGANFNADEVSLNNGSDFTPSPTSQYHNAKDEGENSPCSPPDRRHSSIDILPHDHFSVAQEKSLPPPQDPTAAENQPSPISNHDSGNARSPPTS